MFEDKINRSSTIYTKAEPNGIYRKDSIFT